VGPGSARQKNHLLKGSRYASDELDLDNASRERLDNQYYDLAQRLPVRLYDGTYVSRQVWDLHQKFKEHFLVPLDQERPHALDMAGLQVWIESQSR